MKSYFVLKSACFLNKTFCLIFLLHLFHVLLLFFFTLLSMVVKAEGSGYQRKPVTRGAAQTRSYKFKDILRDYIDTITLRPIDMKVINNILFPLLVFISIFTPQLFIAYSIKLLVQKSFSVWSAIIKTAICCLAVIVFSYIAGFYLRWLISKPEDTSSASYVFVVALSCVYLPAAIAVASAIEAIEWIFFLASALVAEYICSVNMLDENSFVDRRSSFIFNIMLMILYFGFLGGLVRMI